MREHEWTLIVPADPDDPSEAEIHKCGVCGVVRHSEWGTMPVYDFISVKWGAVVGPSDPGCKEKASL